MPHDISRVLAAVSGSTWAIEEAKALEIAQFLALRAEGAGGWDGEDRPACYAGDPVQGRDGAVHVLQLHGTIVPRGGMMARMSGAASLEGFRAAFEPAAADTTAQAIVLNVDSPGGIVDMVAETADMVYAARRPGRPIVAVSNTLMASAAYWIASAADEIVVSPSGRVGSIGVLGQHDDRSEMLRKAGVTRTVLSEGARKAEGVFGPLDGAALKHRQAQARYAYDMFVSAVARHRGVDASVVRADPEAEGVEAHFGGGRVYPAKVAVRQGLADRVATFDDTLARLVAARRPRRAGVARARLALLG
jgi:signal peptide peptidase SppA